MTDRAAARRAALGFLERRRTVPGWLEPADGRVILALDELQARAGLAADLLEIGAYRGRSAIVLGYLRQPGERLFVCDPFEDQPPRGSGGLWVGGKRLYPGLTQAVFERNFARFHAVPPVILRGPSSELPGRVDGRFRLAHVDGSHEPAVIERDITTVRGLLAPGGVAVFEDDHSQHNATVAPAVVRALEAGELTALCLTPWKLYATCGPDVLGLCAGLAAWAGSGEQFRVAHATFAGQETLLLYPLPVLAGPSRALDRKAGILPRP